MGASQGADIEHFSIHALLAESDSQQGMNLSEYILFSIHALLAESDSTMMARYRRQVFFYPRSPCGERPVVQLQCILGRRFFYPRSPCGERRVEGDNVFYYSDFSIHALLAESDEENATQQRETKAFLSTLSLRRATFIICLSFFGY